MAYQPSWTPQLLNEQQVGIPDYAQAMMKGYQAGFMPAVTSTDLLGKALKAKYDAFKSTPAYQQAMLDFLRGQGAHMQGQTNLAKQQADLAAQKASGLRNWMSGIGDESNTSSAEDISYNPQNPNQGQFINDIYDPTTQAQQTTFQPIANVPSTSNEVDQGNKKYQAERGLAAAIGLKEPATFIDPSTGMRYARLRSGTVPIGKEFSESEKQAASERGKAKGAEETLFTAESPDDRQNFKSLLEGVEKVNNGEFDAALGWRHYIPFGANTRMSDKAIGEFAAFEKLLNYYKIKQQSLLAKGQGHITDFNRALLNSTFPDVNLNPVAFKGQLNAFVKDLQQKTFVSKKIRQYEKQGMSFDDARDQAQKESDEIFPSIVSQNPSQSQQSGFKNVSFEPSVMQSNQYQQVPGNSELQSGYIQELKKYAPLAGNVTASSLLAMPNPYAKALGATLAGSIGAYEAVPGKRIQGALENIALDSVPKYAGKLISSVMGKGVAQNTVKATEKLFENRVKPFEKVVSEANKSGPMTTPSNLSSVRDQLKAALSGHQQDWTKQLHDISEFNNKPIFGNAQKAQSALGQIERADVAEEIRAAARDMRKRIKGSMQTHLTTTNPKLVPEYASAMKEYAKSGPMLKDLAAKAKDMSSKDFAAYVKSLTKKGGLPEDLSDLAKSVRRRQALGDVSKSAASAIAPGIPAGAALGFSKILNMLKGV